MSKTMITAKDKRLAWLNSQPESPGKELAKEISEIWLLDGESSAIKIFNDRTRELKLKLWEILAIKDMILAYKETE